MLFRAKTLEEVSLEDDPHFQCSNYPREGQYAKVKWDALPIIFLINPIIVSPRWVFKKKFSIPVLHCAMDDKKLY